MDSGTTSNSTLGLIPISISKILERFAFYGMRSVLVLYLVHELEFTSATTSSVYGIFLLITGLMQLFGGLIGDLLIGTKLSTIIGGFCQAVGYFLLAVPNQIAFYAGLFMIAFGCGLYISNSTSMVSSIYRNRTQKMDSAITIVYICVNFGAFLSQFFIPLITKSLGYRSGFIICGVFVIISQLVLIFLRSLLQEIPTTPNIYSDEKPKRTNIELRIIIITGTMILLPFFWMIYQVAGFNMFSLTDRVHESFPSFSNISLTIGPIITIAAGTVLAIIWYFVKMSSYLKIAIGLLIYALSCIFISMAYNNEGSTGLIIFAVIFILLETVSELFIAPIALSVICQLAPVRFNATLIGGYLCISSIVNYFISSVISATEKVGPAATFVICAIILTIVSTLFFLFYFLTRKENISDNP